MENLLNEDGNLPQAFQRVFYPKANPRNHNLLACARVSCKIRLPFVGPVRPPGVWSNLQKRTANYGNPLSISNLSNSCGEPTSPPKPGLFVGDEVTSLGFC